MEREETLQKMERNTSIDLIKSFAIFCVLCIHACGIFYSQEVGSTPWTWGVFWGSISRSAVPLFFMASGALMLNPKKNIPLEKLYKKNIPRILLALFFWATLYKFFDLGRMGILEKAEIKQALEDLLLFRHQYHLYFLVIILVFYVSIPPFRIFLQGAKKKDIQYALGIWLVFGVIYNNLQAYPPFKLLTGSIQQAAISQTWTCLGYCLLGHYLLHYPLEKKNALLLSCLSFLITCLGTYFSSVSQGVFDTNFLSGTSLGVCLFSLGNFAFLLHFKGGKASIFLSKASFCIYLTHVFFLSLFTENAWIYPFFPLGLQVPVLVLMTLVPSILAYLLLSRIPWVKKWLI